MCYVSSASCTPMVILDDCERTSKHIEGFYYPSTYLWFMSYLISKKHLENKVLLSMCLSLLDQCALGHDVCVFMCLFLLDLEFVCQ